MNTNFLIESAELTLFLVSSVISFAAFDTGLALINTCTLSKWLPLAPTTGKRDITTGEERKIGIYQTKKERERALTIGDYNN